MNLNELRVVIIEEIAAILLDLSADEDMSQTDRQQLNEAMLDTADILAEALDLQVDSIVDGIATVRLNIAGPDVQKPITSV